MKCVILAGGLGTRLSEETDMRPKPMVEIGGRPILWHIMKSYSHYGIKDFIICCGYKGYIIKEYFLNYKNHLSDITVDLGSSNTIIHSSRSEDWRVTLVDTGEHSMTAGRLKRVENYLTPGEPFCFTYGDGLADIDIGALINFHKHHGKMATVTAVPPPGRFGTLKLEPDAVVSGFDEKLEGKYNLINAGYFVLSPEVINFIDDDETIWEEAPMKNLTARGELLAFTHTGFWRPMDTLRDKNALNALWGSGEAPWRVW
jgi:glucose-1-phosphate cytidylyltransferase